MASKIEWYVVELERMLRGRVAEDSLRELQSETRDHLTRLSNEFGEPNAEEKAIRSFGSPHRLAMRYIRDDGPVDRGVLAILLVIAAICYAFPIYLFDENPKASSFGGFLGWTGMLGVFFIVCLWFRRFKPLPILAALSIAALFTSTVVSYRFVFIDDPHSSGLFTLSEAKIVASRSLSPALDPKAERLLHEGLIAFHSAKPNNEKLSKFRTSSGYLVPSFPAKSGGSKLVWQNNPTYEGARRHWQGWVERFVTDRQWERDRNATLKRMIAAAPAPGFGNLGRALRFAFWWAGMAAILLLGINVAAAAMVYLFDWGSIVRRRLA